MTNWDLRIEGYETAIKATKLQNEMLRNNRLTSFELEVVEWREHRVVPAMELKLYCLTKYDPIYLGM